MPILAFICMLPLVHKIKNGRIEMNSNNEDHNYNKQDDANDVGRCCYNSKNFAANNDGNINCKKNDNHDQIDQKDDKRIYISEQEVLFFESDFTGNLRLPYIFCFMQEAAQKHAAILSFGHEDLLLDDRLWVLSRVYLKIMKQPVVEDKIKIKTWHKGSDGIFAFRDFIITDEKDNVLVLATTSWVVVDQKTRKPIRNLEFLNNESKVNASSIEKSFERLPKFAKEIKDDLENHVDKNITVKEFQAMYSGIDINRHVTNSKFVEWICDALGDKLFEGHLIEEFQINYNNEMHYHDKVKVYLKMLDELNYICDTSNSNFQAKILLKQK